MWFVYADDKKFSIDKHRLLSGNPNIISWQKSMPDSETLDELELSEVALKMFPVVSQSEKKLTATTKSLDNNGYTLRDNPKFNFDKAFDWGANPKRDNNWHFKVNAWDMLVPYFQVYEHNRQVDWLDTPLKIALDWVDFNLIQNKTNAFKWYDMATGLRAIQLAILISELDSMMSQPNKRKLVYAAQAHVQVLKRPELLSEGNHGFFQLAGLASLCKVLAGLSECNDTADFLNDSFSSLINKQFSKEGVHLEHSSQYHPWAAKVIGNIQLLNLFEEQHFESLNLARDNAKWFFQPDGLSGLIGGSERKNVGQYKNLSPSMEYLENNETGEKPTENLAIFKDAGFGAYRSHWEYEKSDITSYLLGSAAFHSRVHKQNDDFTFEWFEKGQPIISDSGKYSYDDDELTQFFRSRFAHNTVTVGDEVRWFSREKPYGSALIGGGEFDGLIWMEFERYRKDVSTQHYRLLILNPENWLLVLDHLDSKTNSDFTQWFHFDPSLIPSESNNGLRFINDKNSLAVDVQYSTNSLTTLNVYRGQDDPFAMGWVSDKYKKVTERSSLGITANGKKQVVFATLLSINQSPIGFEVIESKDGHLYLCWGEAEDIQGIGYSSTVNLEIKSCGM